ncbi:MAG: homocysteine S-methyltransferase family protein [Pseudomonadota bacterium]
MTITLLDGGMGQELTARIDEAPTGLWATKFMMDHPGVVRAIHRDFFEAGAQVATANTYAIHHDRLVRHEIDDQFAQLHLKAVELAAEARDAHGSGMVAGSLGPLGWSYRADLAPPVEEAAALYAEIVELQDPFVDLFIAETMSGIDQAKGALTGMAGTKKPRWVALSVNDVDGTKLRSGEDLTGALPMLEGLAPDGVLINCARPEAIDSALPVIAPLGIPFGGYANGFIRIAAAFTEADSSVDALQARDDLGPARYADFAEGWAEAGATLIGGCCEIGPAHIAELSRRLL